MPLLPNNRETKYSATWIAYVSCEGYDGILIKRVVYSLRIQGGTADNV